jgi:ABC-type nitrate/sulfonate/bicarbonate transport system ATPase subunit
MALFGGQRQRVFGLVAPAAANLLLDYPFSHLDAVTARAV